MTDKKSSESRRKLLKSIAAGSGAIVAGKSLPESWSRPVVDSVMLPAHAETSPITGPFAGTADVDTGSLGSDSIFTKATDALIPQAHAGPSFPPYVCVEANSTQDKATVKLLADKNGPKMYTFNNVPVNGSTCTYKIDILCDDADAGDLMRDLGLINDAHALPEEVCCSLESVTGTGVGRITFSEGYDVDFGVGPSTCKMPDPCMQIVDVK